MFNLSPRWKRVKPNRLGPNLYQMEVQEVLRNRVPFLSTAERKTLVDACSTDAIYNVQLPFKVKGGLNMGRQSERTLFGREYSSAGTGPGPGSYDLELKKTRIGEKKGRKLYVCSVPYFLEARGPSVPSKADANGYDFNEDMELVKIPPDDLGDVAGTTDIPKVSCLTKELYGGCCWSKLRSERFPEAKMAPSPGPAAYDPSAKPSVNERDEYVREMARRYCPQTRYLDAMLHRTQKENFPAPNEYNITNFKSNPCSTMPYPRSRRFKNLTSTFPACNAYSLSKDLGKAPVSYIKSPFGSCTSRFRCKTVATTPGPADYRIQDTMEDRQLKNLKELTYKSPPFNRSSLREAGLPDKEDVPASNTYNLEGAETLKEPCGGCNFRSVTCRFQEERKMKSAEPASFDVSEAYRRNNDRKSHNVREVPFDSKLPRGEAKKFVTPAPSQYLGHRPVDSKGYFFHTVERREKLNENPGPGCYTIHPTFALSMYRTTATHNLRLKENVMREKLKVSPARTRSSWMHKVKKRKTLLAFYTPPPKRLASWIVSD